MECAYSSHHQKKVDNCRVRSIGVPVGLKLPPFLVSLKNRTLCFILCPIACALSSGLGSKSSRTRRRARQMDRFLFSSSTRCSGHALCSSREFYQHCIERLKIFVFFKAMKRTRKACKSTFRLGTLTPMKWSPNHTRQSANRRVPNCTTRMGRVRHTRTRSVVTVTKCTKSQHKT